MAEASYICEPCLDGTHKDCTAYWDRDETRKDCECTNEEHVRIGTEKSWAKTMLMEGKGNEMNRMRELLDNTSATPEDDTKVRTRILESADDLINGDREQIYGPPEVNFLVIANLLNAMGYNHTDRKGHSRALNATDVALMMTQVKLGRLVTTPEHKDSWVDGAGYLALGAETAVFWPKPVTIVYQYLATADLKSDAAHYFWRCETCQSYVEKDRFASHAWLKHQTRDFEVREDVKNETPDAKPSIRFMVRVPGRKGGFFRREVAEVWSCSGCGEKVYPARVVSHMNQVHPHAKTFLAPQDVSNG